MLSFIGIGLYDEKDISLKGLDKIKKSDIIYLEQYTAKLMGCSLETMEKIYGKKITTLSRADIEQTDKIIQQAKTKKIAFFVAGDSMTATTHTELRLRAIENNIQTEIIHGSSILTAAPSLAGLQHYKFGKTVSLPYPEKNFFPTSSYDNIKQNKKMGLHTLLLLDIKPDKYMTANEAMQILLQIETIKKEKITDGNCPICVIARAGSKHPTIKAGQITDLINMDFGLPLHALIILGKLHFMEVEALSKLAETTEDAIKIYKQ